LYYKTKPPQIVFVGALPACRVLYPELFERSLTHEYLLQCRSRGYFKAGLPITLVKNHIEPSCE